MFKHEYITKVTFHFNFSSLCLCLILFFLFFFHQTYICHTFQAQLRRLLLPDKTKCFKCAWNQKSTGITSVYLLRTRPNLWKKNEFIWQFQLNGIPNFQSMLCTLVRLVTWKLFLRKRSSKKKKKRLNNVGIRSSLWWNLTSFYLTLKIIWSCRSISNFKT